MSKSGHWFDPESAEQYLETLDALRARTSAAYDRLVKQDLKQIETQLSALADSDQELAMQTRRQLQEVVELVGRFKSQTASALLELEQETKQIREAMAQALKKQSDLDAQKLNIEKSKLQLERWKLVLGAIGLFLTGWSHQD
jgi:gas vesicle protein